MARGIARVGDRTLGSCSIDGGPIGGTIVSGSPDTITNSRLEARLGDTVIADCGHTGTISSASSTIITNGQDTARLGDSVSGTYSATIVSASSDVIGD